MLLTQGRSFLVRNEKASRITSEFLNRTLIFSLISRPLESQKGLQHPFGFDGVGRKWLPQPRPEKWNRPSPAQREWTWGPFRCIDTIQNKRKMCALKRQNLNGEVHLKNRRDFDAFLSVGVWSVQYCLLVFDKTHAMMDYVMQIMWRQLHVGGGLFSGWGPGFCILKEFARAQNIFIYFRWIYSVGFAELFHAWAKQQFIFLTQEKSRFAWLRPFAIRPHCFTRLQPWCFATLDFTTIRSAQRANQQRKKPLVRNFSSFWK